jgi:hypothetical protein
MGSTSNDGDNIGNRVDHARREQDVVAEAGNHVHRGVDAALPQRCRVRLRVCGRRDDVVLSHHQS